MKKFTLAVVLCLLAFIVAPVYAKTSSPTGEVKAKGVKSLKLGRRIRRLRRSRHSAVTTTGVTTTTLAPVKP